jgi:restriction system protein
MMEPIAFEHLIGQLLESMNYQSVVVTAPSNDRGVDVVADIELGITSVREVVQAKRQKSNVQRTILDALRGSLYRFQAVRGTIITTAGFSKGAMQAAFEAGAPPITLIDGSKLMDLPKGGRKAPDFRRGDERCRGFSRREAIPLL